jgi:outer membrane protein
VGHVPTRLDNPTGIERLLPPRLEDAIEAAETHNPAVLQSAFNEKASSYEIKRTLGQMLPQVTFQASHNERYNPSTVLYQQSVQSAMVRVNIPIYQAGDVEARVRQVKQQRQGQIQDIESARELARAQAISTYAQVEANRAQVVAVREQVHAANETVNGVREEQRAGQRTLLDVLNAEQELTSAQVAAANARHDLVVASYTLLATMGRLTAYDLGLNVRLYDERKHYAEVNGKWGGLSIARDENYTGRDPSWAPMVETR